MPVVTMDTAEELTNFLQVKGYEELSYIIRNEIINIKNIFNNAVAPFINMSLIKQINSVIEHCKSNKLEINAIDTFEYNEFEAIGKEFTYKGVEVSLDCIIKVDENEKQKEFINWVGFTDIIISINEEEYVFQDMNNDELTNILGEA